MTDKDTTPESRLPYNFSQLTKQAKERALVADPNGALLQFTCIDTVILSSIHPFAVFN